MNWPRQTHNEIGESKYRSAKNAEYARCREGLKDSSFCGSYRSVAECFPCRKSNIHKHSMLAGFVLVYGHDVLFHVGLRS